MAGYFVLKQRSIDDENFFDAKSEEEELREEKHQKDDIVRAAPESGDTDTVVWNANICMREKSSIKKFSAFAFFSALEMKDNKKSVWKKNDNVVELGIVNDVTACLIYYLGK